MSFTGPVDLDTFHLRKDVWEEVQRKTAVFVKLGTYLLPENDRPPHKGIHICHVLLVFPIDQQPWKSLLGWMRDSAAPFPKGSWIACSGRILGVLNRATIKGPRTVDSTTRILVVLPDDWDFIRQSSLVAQNPSSLAPKTPLIELPTPPRATGPGGVGSWNPFSSPIHEKPSVQGRLENKLGSARGKEKETPIDSTLRTSGKPHSSYTHYRG